MGMEVGVGNASFKISTTWFPKPSSQSFCTYPSTYDIIKTSKKE
jgi:hypothetical protein